MPVDWDADLLAPLHEAFGERVIYHPESGEPYEISGIFDRAYTQDVEPIEGDVGINTTKPLLGVRDTQFKKKARQGDRVYIKSVDTMFIVKDVQPDSHGGTRLELNQWKA